MSAEIDIRQLSSLGRGSRRRLRNREQRLRRVGARVSDTRKTYRAILEVLSPVIDDVESSLAGVIRGTEFDWFIGDAFDDDIRAAFERLRQRHTEANREHAETVAIDMGDRVNRSNRRRFMDSVTAKVGIDLSGIITEARIGPILSLKTRENVELISSIPSEYLSKVERLVSERVIQGRTSSKSMIEEITELGHSTRKRARFIARDQTAKLNAALNRERNQAIGIEEYIWRISKDERVRKTHKANNGKRFRWDNPPKTGAPGEDFQCRCVPEPIIPI